MESIPGILETGWEPPAQDRSRSTRNSDDKADQVDSGFSSDGSGNLRARLTEGAVVVVTLLAWFLLLLQEHLSNVMKTILTACRNHQSSWPFLNSVDRKVLFPASFRATISASRRFLTTTSTLSSQWT